MHSRTHNLANAILTVGVILCFQSSASAFEFGNKPVAVKQTTPVKSQNMVKAQNPTPVPAEDESLAAVVVPSIESTISSEIPGRINKIAMKEGQRFKEGEELIVFDCAMHEASLMRTQADVKAAEASFTAKKKLKELSSASALEVTLAEADYDRARADYMKASAIVDHCKIKAPYDGAVVNIMVHPYDTIKEGQAVIRLIALGSPEIELLVPSDKLSKVKQGGGFVLSVDEISKNYRGLVTNIVPRIDPVSQMFKVKGTLQDIEAGKYIIPGMTGSAALVK